MSFKSEYFKYCNAINQANKSYVEISEWFDNFDLKYSINNHAGDGVCILDHDSGLSAIPSLEQIERISKSKSRKDVICVINELNFYL